MDYYRVLNVRRDASSGDIKAAYRKLALQWHPDRHQNASKAQAQTANARFKELVEAYEVLGDDAKRAVYNREGRRGVNTRATGQQGADTWRPPPKPGRGFARSGDPREGARRGQYQYGHWADSTRGEPGSSQYAGSSGGRWQRAGLWRGLTRGDVAFHVALAGLVLGGVFFGERLSGLLWQSVNLGKSFEETMEAVERRQRGRSAAGEPSAAPPPEAPNIALQRNSTSVSPKPSA